MSKFRNKKNDTAPSVVYKLITLGDSSVGKTSIINRYISGKFDQKSSISTIGFGCYSKEMILKDGTKIKITLIDTAGQENYLSLSATYFKNADGVLFIFAHDDNDSFDNLSRWIKNLYDSNHEIDSNQTFPAYLVGNKCDLEHKINEDKIEDFKKENKFYGYIDTSAKEDIGINELFEEMGEMLYKIYGKRKNLQNKKLLQRHARKKIEGNWLKKKFCSPDV